MKKLNPFLVMILAGSNAFGNGAEIAIGPNGTQNVKLTVGNTLGDFDYMWLDLGGPIDLATHPVVTVQFDTYRYNWGLTPGRTLHNMYWGWVDADDSVLVQYDTTPNTYGTTWGAYWDINNQTYPFGWFDYNAYHANTVLDDYATITLEWNTTTGMASAWYDGSIILLNTPINEPLTDLLRGYDITLNHGSDTGAGTDMIWIDNFQIMGSDIYSTDFESFDLGNLDGQQGWVSGDRTVAAAVPEPSSLLLVAIGLGGATMRRIRSRRRPTE